MVVLVIGSVLIFLIGAIGGILSMLYYRRLDKTALDRLVKRAHYKTSADYAQSFLGKINFFLGILIFCGLAAAQFIYVVFSNTVRVLLALGASEKSIEMIGNLTAVVGVFVAAITGLLFLVISFNYLIIRVLDLAKTDKP